MQQINVKERFFLEKKQYSDTRLFPGIIIIILVSKEPSQYIDYENPRYEIKNIEIRPLVKSKFQMLFFNNLQICNSLKSININQTIRDNV